MKLNNDHQQQAATTTMNGKRVKTVEEETAVSCKSKHGGVVNATSAKARARNY